MAASGEVTLPLKYKTWVLKVPIHCVGCKREVKKLLQSIEGVYSTSIDSQQQKVTVTGNIEAELLVKKLLKTGKHAEIWNEKPAEKPKKNEKPKESKESKTPQTKEQTTKPDNSESNPPEKSSPKEVKLEKKDKENTPASQGTPNAGNAGKAKKGKGQNGNCSGAKANGNENKNQGTNTVKLTPTLEQFSAIQGPPTVQVMNYNATYPSKLGYGLTYQVPSPPSYYTNEQMETYQVQATQFNTFDIFSDENPHGCSIM